MISIAIKKFLTDTKASLIMMMSDDEFVCFGFYGLSLKFHRNKCVENLKEIKTIRK
jgi:hypothetical protein